MHSTRGWDSLKPIPKCANYFSPIEHYITFKIVVQRIYSAHVAHINVKVRARFDLVILFQTV